MMFKCLSGALCLSLNNIVNVHNKTDHNAQLTIWVKATIANSLWLASGENLMSVAPVVSEIWADNFSHVLKTYVRILSV